MECNIDRKQRLYWNKIYVTHEGGWFLWNLQGRYPESKWLIELVINYNKECSFKIYYHGALERSVMSYSKFFLEMLILAIALQDLPSFLISNIAC